NEYTVSDDRWVLEFYYSRRGVSDETLVHDVMTNEKMWGQDLTLVPGFEQAAAENLRCIRTDGARAAFAACLARPAV
ncbi:tagaturonate reductase, partial [Ruthenibacterium lactatiformans]|nr:tagaturonate reductase [Ruthenibacterium lactatiformans]